MAVLLNASGQVVNVIVTGEGFTPPNGLTIGPDGGQIGWVWTGSEYVNPAPPPAPTADEFATAIQGHVDSVAASRGYGSGVLLASYTVSTVPAWAAEAAAFVAWRDAVWAYAYQQLAAVQSGARPMPTIAEMVSELPVISWPT